MQDISKITNIPWSVDRDVAAEILKDIRGSIKCFARLMSIAEFEMDDTLEGDRKNNLEGMWKFIFPTFSDVGKFDAQVKEILEAWEITKGEKNEE